MIRQLTPQGDSRSTRRANLRVATHALNLANQRPQIGRSSQYKGVSLYRQDKWESYIKINGRKINLGHFNDEVEAALAYDRAAIAAWGSFARPNFVEV